MALSGTIAFNLTAQEMANAILQKLGVIGENANADASKYAIVQRELNLMLRSWQMGGPRLWGRAEGALTLVSGTQTYTLSPRPMKLHTLRFAIDGAERYPLSKWGQEDWDNFPAKTRTGQPTIYTLDRQRSGTSVTLWPAPSFSGAAWTCPYTYERVFEDVTGAAQDIDVPQEWLELVQLALATRCMENWPAGDAKDRDRYAQIRARAKGLYDEAMGFDRDGDVMFYPG